MRRDKYSAVGVADELVRAFFAGGALLLLAGGCASGPQNVVVNVAPYVAQASAGSAAGRGTIRIEATKDARRDAVGALVGERTTIGNMSLGSIETKPPPSALVTDVVQRELAGMGFSIVTSGERSRVGAQLAKFQVATPATALYWDINGVAEIDLAATGPDGKRHETRYAVQCTGRTYSWPSEEVIGGVISSCLKEIGARMRGDSALLDLLDGR